MAASDAFYRDQKMLHRVFAATSVAMLVTVVWMFADDFRRPYKQDQRTFRTVEEEIQVGDTKASLAQAQRELKAKEASHKKLTGDFDRFLKLAVQKQWTWRDAVRSLPVMDAFASPVKIKQTFHEDLPIDYGGFKY